MGEVALSAHQRFSLRSGQTFTIGPFSLVTELSPETRVVSPLTAPVENTPAPDQATLTSARIAFLRNVTFFTRLDEPTFVHW